MENKILFGAVLFIACLSSQLVNAQLKVAENGNVAINSGTYTPLSKLTIGNTAGLSSAKLYVHDSGNGLLHRYGIYSFFNCGNGADKYAIYGYSTGSGGMVVGIKGEAMVATNISVPTIGVYGIGRGSNNGRNYGIFGTLKSGSDNGAGIYGTTDESTPVISDRYAGYFNGLTNCNGDLLYTQSYATSDARLKTNIADVKSEATSKLKELRPVQFQWQQIEDVTVEDTTIVRTPHFSNDIDMNKKHYGLLAQDVQKLFPDMVHEDGAGYLSVNYIELIPLLIQTVQELSTEVEELKKQTK